MPKSPNPKTIDSPIRKLRRRLSPDPKKPISQAKLAELIGVSTDLIISLENLRIREGLPTEAVAEKIARAFFAYWDPELGDWRLMTLHRKVLTDPDGNPYLQPAEPILLDKANLDLVRRASVEREKEISYLQYFVAEMLRQITEDHRFSAASDELREFLFQLTARNTSHMRDGWKKGMRPIARLQVHYEPSGSGLKRQQK